MKEVLCPMLASPYSPEKLRFPVFGSPKIDGIRGHILNATVYSRSAKPIRNRHIQSAIGKDIWEGFDGELVFGPASAPDVYNQSSSGIMAKEGHPTLGIMDWDFWVFDNYLDSNLGYEARMNRVHHRLREYTYPNELYVPNIKVLPQTLINSEDDLDTFEQEQLTLGYEGVMLRAPLAPYKFGRSSVKDGALLKVKRFSHDEAYIVGFEELMHNDNEQTRDELGRAKRSDAREGLRGSGMLGAYICESPKYTKSGVPIPFNVSCGSMSHNVRRKAWENRSEALDTIVRFRHLPYGAKDVPRHGLYAGFRDPDDL